MGKNPNFTRAAWHVFSNGHDSPAMIEFSGPELSEAITESGSREDGYWFIVHRDAGHMQETAVRHLVETVRATTSALNSHMVRKPEDHPEIERDTRAILTLLGAFCSAFNLIRLPEEKLPEPIRNCAATNKNVYAVAPRNSKENLTYKN